ncbi:TonB-dependent receptor [Tamlana sp. 2201CG12-4]|uniref:SusC/RagA family TonB-linked outer membrane protein n=1 Tax=Tamlana sp. 2201CG12-4 TaxID=3112582 RepID=UPI002DBE3591|nr:TonB-dependent receptor [Tamlana sp. 2201CG12-4]MEC3908231.1 TonB-dependent receptor [Tamlana sp. 2201CG12-4]
MRAFIFLCFTTVFSLVPDNVLSQNSKIKISTDKILTVDEVFDLIMDQTDYKFIYQEGIFNDFPKVQVKKGTILANDLLNKSLLTGNFSIIVTENNTVVVQEKIDEVGQNTAQGFKVIGTVVDNNSQPLPGTSVVEKGTTNGASTDFDGNYSIVVSNRDAILVFSYLGFTTQEVAVNGQTNLKVTLQEDTAQLDEVVVIGFGSVKKSDLTGAVNRADIESFRQSPNTNVLQSLQGTVPGLNIGMVDQAGETPSLSIRGATTISGNTNPLIVVDGIIYYGNLNGLNPNDIESIDILKDASSVAIYGAQAANGVVLITTKDGSKSEKPQISFSTSSSFIEPAKRLDLFNRDQYLTYVRDVYWDEGYTEESGYTEINPDFDFENYVVSPENIVGLQNGTDTDWYDLATNDAYLLKNNISISGNKPGMKYFVSGSFDNQKNWIVNDKFKRTSIRLNLESEITKWLTVGTQSFASFSDNSGASPSIGNLVLSNPLRTPYDENGDLLFRFETIENPLVPVQRRDLSKDDTYFANFFAKIDIPFIEGLTYRLNHGQNIRYSRDYYADEFAASQGGEVRKRNGRAKDVTLDNIFNYKKSFNENHDLDLTLVAGYQKRKFESTTATARNFSNMTLGYNSIEQGTDQFTASDSWEQTSAYQMGRINYAFKGTYLLTGTLRRDGFSGFAKNQKTAYFPSLAFAWKASNESFLSKDWLDLLKFRLSYGVNGNLVGRYSSLARASSGARYVFGDGGTTAFGHSTTSLPNDDLRWEKTSGFNLGIDFGLFNNVLTGSAEYYTTVTNDLLWSQDIPSITGFNSVIGNVGEVKNNGFELILTARPIHNENFNWSVTTAFSTNRNEVTKLLGDINGDGEEDDLASSGLFIGESLSAIYTYEIEGVYQIDDEIPDGYGIGTYKIKDNNGDGVISADDRAIIGQSAPAYRFSVLNKLDYKNFSLMFNINSIQGGKNGYMSRNDPWGGSLNSSANSGKHATFAGLDYWTPSNPNGRYRLPGALGAITPGRYQQRSFVRLQDVSLGYNFENSFVQKIGFENLRLYVSGKNLFTITDWDGMDPESGSGVFYTGRPVMRSYTFGLDVTF